MQRKETSLAVWSVSLGCPKNRVDTERLLGSLGCRIRFVRQKGRAQLIFVNTCGFIEPAVRESVQTILQLAQAISNLKKRPFFAVGGCLVGRYGAKELAKEIPEVDLWLESSDLEHWPERLSQALLGQSAGKGGRLLSTGPSYAWLKIGEGCRHRCAFCTIPDIRGPLKSSASHALLAEADALLAQGVREIDLVAQDVTDYGKDTGESLQSLISELCRRESLLWLRLLYLYPTGLDEAFLRFLRDTGAPLLPYFDIPLQHAHPEILSRMGRPFAQDAARIVERVRRIVPDAVIRTTCIVGFPGETDAHFAHLCRFVEENGFSHLGVFTYQREEGTKAYSYPDQVPEAVAQARRDELMEIQRSVSQELLTRYVGQRLPVLVDSVNEEWPGLHNGRLWFQAPEVDGQTYISGPGVAPGQVVSADIVESADYDLTALA
ncbi:MAG: 30S ribosomal protein S12 methylthiotransferase RimO [Desulfovibrio sp.]|nr:30S ribosomal protein S12 methylthiotransferase RimO [Desulfovibrio sp.]